MLGFAVEVEWLEPMDRLLVVETLGAVTVGRRARGVDQAPAVRSAPGPQALGVAEVVVREVGPVRFGC